MYMHICICVGQCIYIYTYACVCIYVCVYVCVYFHKITRLCVKYTHLRKYTHKNTHTKIHTPKYTHKNTHTRIHTQKPAWYKKTCVMQLCVFLRFVYFLTSIESLLRFKVLEKELTHHKEKNSVEEGESECIVDTPKIFIQTCRVYIYTYV